MATTRQRSRPTPRNGGSAAAPEVVEKAATETTRRARGPLIAAGAATAGLAGGWAIGAKRRGRRRSPLTRRRVLGVPVGHKPGLIRTAELLRDGARELHIATGRVAATGDEMRQVREQLEKINRRSPVEVVLDGLTHRRGVHRNES